MPFSQQLGQTDIQGMIQALMQYGGDPNAPIADPKNPRNIQTMIQQLQDPSMSKYIAPQALGFLNTVGSPSVGQGKPDVYGDTQLAYTGAPGYSTGNGNITTGQSLPPQPQANPGGPGGPPTNAPMQTRPDQLSTSGTPVNQATVPGTDISQYIPGTSQQQQEIINNAIKQSQDVSGQDFNQLQNVINPWIQQQFSQYTDPNSPGNQQMMGELNNTGSANGGAFPQALASRLAPLISQGQMQLGEGAFLPAFATQQGLVTSGAGDQSNLGLASLQRFIDQQNFQQQSTLANQLADKGVPSAGQTAVGMGSSILSGLGDFGMGFGGLKQAAGSLTWICTHLKKLGLATETEVEAVHARLYPTIVSHPIHWIHYVLSAPRLIELCDAASLDWRPVKAILIDAVLAEPDSEKAFQIYRSEVKCLCAMNAPKLWKLEALA